MMSQANAFIGASLGSRLFTRHWVRYAFEHALKHHGRLLVVIADELWLYTRAGGDGGQATFGIEEAENRIRVIREEMARLFEACRAQLPAKDAKRIEIASWSTYSDAEYAHLLRAVRCAAAYLMGFAASVDAAAERHVSAIESQTAHRSGMRVASRDYVLDEMAMCIRITELSEYSAEYYPGEDLSVLRELYTGQFAPDGLSVKALVGKPGQRVFTNLKVPDDEE